MFASALDELYSTHRLVGGMILVSTVVCNKLAASSRLRSETALRCLRGKRVVIVGDSTSRYEYDQLTIWLRGVDESTLSPNPLDTSIFYRIPPRGNESTLLPAWARDVPATPEGCPAYETQSKWA